MLSLVHYIFSSKIRQSLNLLFLCAIFPTLTLAESLALTLSNETDRAISLTYMSGRANIQPMPESLDAGRSVKLTLSSKQLPVIANIALKEYDINLVFFNNRMAVTYCDFTILKCKVEQFGNHYVVHFSKRSS